VPVQDCCSAAAVEGQQKTLERISDSRHRKNPKSLSETCDRKSEKFSISCNTGEWIKPLRDSQRCSVVRKGFIHPELRNEEYTKDEKANNIILKNGEKQNRR
jgi:hypothetical protein